MSSFYHTIYLGMEAYSMIFVVHFSYVCMHKVH